MSDPEPIGTSAAGGVVIASSPKQWWRKKPFLILLAVAAVLLLVAGGIWYQRYEHNRLLKQDKVNYDSAVLDSSALRGKRQYDKAMVPLRDYVKISRDNKNKAYALTLIGNMYEIQNKYPEALAVFRQAETARGQDDYVITMCIARDAQAVGDRKTAIEYYKKTIAQLEIAKSSNFTLQYDIDRYKNNIKQLENTK